MPIVSEKIVFNRLILIVPDHLTVTKVIGPLFQFPVIDLVALSLSRSPKMHHLASIQIMTLACVCAFLQTF